MKRWIPDDLEKRLTILLLAAIALLMLAQALCRHLLPWAAAWQLKAAAGCLAWLISLGMAGAAAQGTHIRMPFLAGLVPPAGRARLARFADLAFLLFALCTLAAGCVALYLSLGREQLPSHPIVYAAIPAGSLLAVVRLIGRLKTPRGGGEGG